MKLILFLLIIGLVLFQNTPLVLAESIKLNEFYSAGSTNPETGPDWVEIYNEGTDIALYQLLDSDNHPKSLTSANCNGNFCTVDWSNLLNNNGDAVKLILISSGEVVDQVTYGTPGDITPPLTGQSGGRSLDGEGGWILFSTPTKGSTNNSSTPIPTSTPTLTPTPQPTPTPTSTPTPISTPTPTKTTPTRTPTPVNPTSTKAPTPTTKIPSPSSAPTHSKESSPEATSDIEIPQSIKEASVLGATSDQSSPSPSPSLSQSSSLASPFSKLLAGAGIAVTVLGGILFATFIAQRRR